MDYKTPTERKLRQHRGFVLPVDLSYHSELHANVDPAFKPNAAQASQLLNEIGDFQLGRGGLYILHRTIELFHVWAGSDSEVMAERATEIAENLEEQSSYLTYREPHRARSTA